MVETRAERTHLRILWRKAKKVGFTPEGLRRMFAILNLDPKTMQLDDLRDLWPYVNPINAKKFSYEGGNDAGPSRHCSKPL